MRVTGEFLFDETLKKRLDMAGGGASKNLTDKECRAYLEFYRTDIATLLSEIHKLRAAIQDIGAYADLMALTGEQYLGSNADPVASAHFFSNTFRHLYVSILNQLSRFGLSRDPRTEARGNDVSH